MLACARIGAPHNVVFGGFSRRVGAERMEFCDAKALITVDGARRKGKTAPVKPEVDAVARRPADARDDPRRSQHRRRLAMQDGRDVWFDEALAAADAVCPAEPSTPSIRCSSSTPSGSTAKPKGILHTTGGYLTGVAWTIKYVFDLKPERDVYWCSADVGWITGHTYIVYGPLANGATSVMYEGAPDYPRQGHLVGARRALRRDDLLHRADGDPRLHEVGRRVRRAATTSSTLRLLGTSASRSTRRRGSGTTRSSAAGAARSSTRGGRPRPARS